MKKVMNKKGQDLSIGTLILIVLGIVVLVLLILGFSIGWSNLWEKINIFQGGSSISDVITSCKLAVVAGNTFDYCQNFNKIKIDGNTEYLNCQDTRVQSGLQGSGLPCSSPYDSSFNSAVQYCNKLKADNLVNDKTQVNTVFCSSKVATNQPVSNRESFDTACAAAAPETLTVSTQEACPQGYQARGTSVGSTVWKCCEAI